MEPEYAGFCVGCNGYSEHLKSRIARNNITGKTVIGMFCEDCRKRFGLYPYDTEEMKGDLLGWTGRRLLQD